MKRRWYLTAQAGLLLGVTVIALLLLADTLQQKTRASGDPSRRGREIGAIRSISGDARYKDAEGIDWQAARENASVREDDRLQTLGGSMSIVLVDKTQPVSVAENSMVVFRSNDESAEEEVEIEKGSIDLATLGEKRVRLRSGSMQIRSRPRYVEFVPGDGPLPAEPLQRVAMELRHAGLLLTVVRRLGVPETELLESKAILSGAGDLLGQGLYPAARADADRAYDRLLALFRTARRTQRAIVSVSRDEKGDVRVQALQGEVTITSPLKKVTLREGEGVRLTSTGSPDAKRRLLDPPQLAWPLDKQTVWNTYQPALAWEPLKGAVSYTVELARDKTFTDLIASTPSVHAQWAPAKPLADGKYYWRVRANDAEKFVGMYATREFAVGTDHVAPALDLTMKYKWEEPR